MQQHDFVCSVGHLTSGGVDYSLSFFAVSLCLLQILRLLLQIYIHYYCRTTIIIITVYCKYEFDNT